jgi:hypothetical protein
MVAPFERLGLSMLTGGHVGLMTYLFHIRPCCGPMYWRDGVAGSMAGTDVLRPLPVRQASEAIGKDVALEDERACGPRRRRESSTGAPHGAISDAPARL